MRQEIYKIIHNTLVSKEIDINIDKSSEEATQKILEIVKVKMNDIFILSESIINMIELMDNFDEEQEKIKIRGLNQVKRIIDNLCA